MRSTTSVKTRKPAVQYGRRGTAAATRRNSVRPNDDNDEYIETQPASTSSSKVKAVARITPDQWAGVNEDAVTIPPRKPDSNPARRRIVEVVNSPPKQSPTNHSPEKKQQASKDDVYTDIPGDRKRKTRVEALASEGDESTGVESDDPLALTPNKRFRSSEVISIFPRPPSKSPPKGEINSELPQCHALFVTDFSTLL